VKPLGQQAFLNAFLQSRPRLAFWMALALIMLFGVAQAYAYFGRSLSLDEPFTVNLASGSFAEIIEALRHDTPAPLHYLLLSRWVRLFGESEFSVRSLSAACFALTILTVGVTARRAVGPRGGLIAALLLAVSTNMGIVYAATARMYALLGLQVAVAAYLCLRRAQRRPSAGAPSWRADAWWAALLAAVTVSGLLTHLVYGAFMVAVLVASTVYSRRMVVLVAACGLASGLLYLALWWPVLREGLPLPTWMQRPSLADWADGFLNLWGAKKTLLIGTYAAGLTLLRFSRARGVLANRDCLFAICTVTVASLLPFLVSQVRPVYLQTRTPIIFLPMACVLAAVLMSQLGETALTLAVLALLAIGSARSSIGIFTGPDPTPARASVRSVVEAARCGDTLVLGSLSVSEVQYYLRRFGAPACIHRETFPPDTERHPGWMDVRGLMNQRDELAQQAAETAARLARRPTSTVWLFGGRAYGSQVTDVLKAELDRQLTAMRTLDLRGSFFDSVDVYAATTQEPPVPIPPKP
jgi:hypothetical protein